MCTVSRTKYSRTYSCYSTVVKNKKKYVPYNVQNIHEHRVCSAIVNKKNMNKNNLRHIFSAIFLNMDSKKIIINVLSIKVKNYMNPIRKNDARYKNTLHVDVHIKHPKWTLSSNDKKGLILFWGTTYFCEQKKKNRMRDHSIFFVAK